MAITTNNQGTNLGKRIVKDTAVTNSVVHNVTGASGSIHTIFVDNSALSAVVFLKFWDQATTVTLGTTDPVLCFMIPASSREVLNFPDGLAFSTGISYACVQTPGTAGTAAPATPPTIYLITS